MIYFDSCSIAKFYLAEPDDSPNVTAFANSKTNIGCLLIGKAEIIAVFHRKLREGVVDVRGFHLLCDQFESDCASGLWQWRPVDDELLRLSALRFRGLSARHFSGLLTGCTSLARLRKAARRSTPATAI